MKRFLIPVALVAGGLVSAHAAGFRINETPSMPRGVWHVTALQEPVRRGNVVSVCLPDQPEIRLAVARGYIGHGFCRNGLEPIIKPVAAVAGDKVMVSPAGITVNGRLLSQSAPLTEDSAGRAVASYPPGNYHVAAGSVWLISSYNTHSFDSRYFGPVPVARIQGGASPVLVAR